MSMSRLPLMYFSFDGPMFLKSRWLLRDLIITSSVLPIIFRASSSQTVTHSAQPLHLDGIDDDLEHAADAAGLLLAAVVVLLGLRPLLGLVHLAIGFGDRCELLSHSSSPSTLPRMAVSGHSVTQSMQPVQFSGCIRGFPGRCS